jgi:ribosomal protein S3AE
MKEAKKKKWMGILAPKLFNSVPVGETPAYEAKSVVGRVVTVNLSILIDDMKRQYAEVNLLMENVVGDNANTKMIGYRILPTSIKRNVRKGKSRLDITIRSITKDEQVVTIKLFIISRFIIKGSVKSAILEEAKKFIVKRIAKLDYDAVCEEVINDAMQRELKTRLSKIYPLKFMDIRAFKLERFLKAADLRRIKAEIAHDKKKPEVVVEKEEELIDDEQAEEKSEEKPAAEEPEEEASAEEQAEETPAAEVKEDS